MSRAVSIVLSGALFAALFCVGTSYAFAAAHYVGVDKDYSIRAWSPKNMPIRVYVGAETGVNSSDDLEEMVDKILSAWSKAAGGRITYTFVELPTACDLYVSFTRSREKMYGGNVCSGSCRTYMQRIRKRNYITSCSVVIDNVPTPLPRLSASRRKAIYATTLHELGHALGLGHSDNSSDVMFPLKSSREVLTQRDKNSMAELYRRYRSY